MSFLFRPATNSRSKNRLDYIEALRGLAALYVVCYHMALIPSPSLETPYWATKFILTGGTGVTLFFVVSAFTLTLSMRLHENEPNRILHFYVRRIFRIVPLFYLWIVITYFRDIYWFHVTQSKGTILLSLTFLFNLVPGEQEGFVWASWTLGIEMLFYLFFPLFYHYFNDFWKALGFFFGTIIFADACTYLLPHYLNLDAVQVQSLKEWSFFQYFPVFAFGMVVYFAYEKFIRDESRPSSWAFVFIAVSVLIYSIVSFQVGMGIIVSNHYWEAVVGVAYGTLILGLSIVPVGLFVNRFSRFFGEISYSLYLAHPTLIFALIPIYRVIYFYKPSISLTLSYSASLLLTLGILTVVSYVTYRFIEQPGIRLGSWLIKRWQSSPATAK